jgi:hypothetical protein
VDIFCSGRNRQGKFAALEARSHFLMASARLPGVRGRRISRPHCAAEVEPRVGTTTIEPRDGVVVQSEDHGILKAAHKRGHFWGNLCEAITRIGAQRREEIEKSLRLSDEKYGKIGKLPLLPI